MNVLINAISINEGGGLIVLKKMIEGLLNNSKHIKWYVAATPLVLSKVICADSIIPIPFDIKNKSSLYLIYWYEVKLPFLIYKFNIDLLFSHTNFLPIRSVKCPTILLVQQAGFFSEEFRVLYKKWHKNILKNLIWYIKIRWAYQSIKKSSLVTTQTKYLADCINKKLLIHNKKILVIPHGLGLLMHASTKRHLNFPISMQWRIGYITKFGVQKDFETAIKAIAILKNNQIKFNLIITLDKKDSNTFKINRLIKKYKLENEIENYGQLEDFDKIKNLYKSLHLFIFPSLCESFGFSLVEALANGLPVIVSDTESNREVAAEAGNYFYPKNSEELARNVLDLVSNKKKYIQSSIASLKIAKRYSWDKTAKSIISAIDNLT